MRALIISDVHSNLEALEAVFADAGQRGGFDCVWCLGDMVGYGPNPSECLRLLRSYELSAVAGNHDYAAAGVTSVSNFNGAASAAIRWTREQLDGDDKRFLSELPMVSLEPPFTLVHGSLRAPVEEYLLHPAQALVAFDMMTTPYCLVGHSHLPFICMERDAAPIFLPPQPNKAFSLDGKRCIINPGSVGQPRDRDNRAGYAVFDSCAPCVEHYRVNYDIAATQSKMRRARLPQYLIDRLNQGV